MARITQAHTEYTKYLQVERNLAPRTIHEYNEDIRHFEEFLTRTINGSGSTVQHASREMVRSFLGHLQQDRQFTSTALARILSSLRGFFRFCVEQNYLENNPVDTFRNPKHTKRLPVYLVESELRRLFSKPDQSTPLGCRDHAILVVLANTGLRVSELTTLKTDSIDFERGTLRVFGKGRKERLLPMNAAVRQVLSNWLNLRPISSSNVLFLTMKGHPLGTRGVQLLMRKHGLKANIPRERLTPHKLRHTFATLLHMNEVDIIEIQALLGHANISSTQIYTHTNSGRLRSAVDKLSDLPM